MRPSDVTVSAVHEPPLPYLLAAPPQRPRPNMLGRFSRATLSCGPSASDAVAAWYAGALGLKREPRASGARGEVLDGASSCALAVLELDGFIPPRAPPLLCAPFLTFCVSNLRDRKSVV